MLKHQYQIGVLNSTDANQKRIEESISNLEAESQNMNSRVQQLYMQLLHEIVKKKDIELDSKTVEKKLLNQTVHLYELEVTLWVCWFHNKNTINHFPILIETSLKEKNNHSGDISLSRANLNQDFSSRFHYFFFGKWCLLW